MKGLLRMGIGIAVLFAFMACAEKKVVQKPDTIKVKEAVRVEHSDPGNLTIREFDMNHDKQPDMFKFFDPNTLNPSTKEPVLVKRELDLNADGKVDVWTMYGIKGDVTQESFDLDYDGKIDMVDYFSKGAMIRQEIDNQFDEKPDVFKFYSKGMLIRKEADTNGDGKVNYWEEYLGGEQIKRIGIDLDGDGVVDQWKKPEIEAPQQPAPEEEVAEAAEAPKEEKK